MKKIFFIEFSILFLLLPVFLYSQAEVANSNEETNLREFYGKVIYVDSKIAVVKYKSKELTFVIPEIFSGMIQICQIVKINYTIVEDKNVIKKIEIIKQGNCYK